MKYILILLSLSVLSSCFNNKEQEEEKKLNCENFEYGDGLIIYSKQSIIKPVYIIKYKIDDAFEMPIDTIRLDVYKSKFDKGEGYGASNPDKGINTAYNYKILINDTIEYKLTDIKCKVFSQGGDFMSGVSSMCGVVSYKLNGVLINDKEDSNKNIIIKIE
jgi:hypothetical protein